MPPTGEPGRTVSSRLLDILFAFRPDRPDLSLADLVRATGMPHPTARRLALDLVEAGALERGEDRRFTIGLRLWELGTLAPRTESLRARAQPFMEDLHSALHQHVQLAVLEGREAVIIERFSAPHALGLVSQVGGRLPLHCSGVGKVLLAHGGPELIDKVLDAGLRRYTPQTVVDPAELRAQLAACRRTGTAVVRGELTEGADSVATRIVNGQGHVVAAMSVVLRTGSVTHQAALPSLVAGGLGISRLLGRRPGTRLREGRPLQ
ncbi:IclR family transcriptional regulator [Actinomadura welshii]|uniref:IclR family transcriptional regulator n=1 Tax=Actinomadura welshii TaxID=3103817 RepID=UPI0004140038|nr:IclR family transcriptional regulator [Actinomadura madurae]